MRDRASILAAALLFATTGTAQQLAHLHAPVAVGAGRIVVGGTLLAAAGLTRGRHASLRGRARWLLAGGVGVAVYQVSFFAAVADTGVTVGTLVAIGAAPVLTGALEWLIARRAPGSAWAVATALAVAGVVTLGLASGDAAVSGVGVLLALVASLGYAGYAVIARRLIAAGAESGAVMGGAFGVGALVLLPVLAATGAGPVLAPRGLALVLYLGVAPTAAAYLLYGRGLRTIAASTAATLGLAEPVGAAVLAAAVLGERLTPGAAAGACAVVLALLVLAVPGRRRVLAPA